VYNCDTLYTNAYICVNNVYSLHIIHEILNFMLIMCNCDALYINNHIYVINASKWVNNRICIAYSYNLRIMQHKVALFYISIHNTLRIVYLVLSHCESTYYFVLWRFRCCAYIEYRDPRYSISVMQHHVPR